MENDKVKLEVDIVTLNVILAGIAKLPLEQSIDTFMAIRQQADEQLKKDAPKGPLADKVVK
mgnify:CR=1 FL=1